MDQFEDALAPFIIKEKRIGVSVSCSKFISEILKNINSNIEIVDGENLLNDIRCFKEDKNEV